MFLTYSRKTEVELISFFFFFFKLVIDKLMSLEDIEMLDPGQVERVLILIWTNSQYRRTHMRLENWVLVLHLVFVGSRAGHLIFLRLDFFNT